MQYFGFFRERDGGGPQDDSLVERVGRGDPEVRDVIAAYLTSATVVAVATSNCRDVLAEESTSVGRAAMQSDGAWLWPSDLAYYVRNYNISLPEELIDRARSLNWEPPQLDSEQLGEIEREITHGQ